MLFVVGVTIGDDRTTDVLAYTMGVCLFTLFPALLIGVPAAFMLGFKREIRERLIRFQTTAKVDEGWRVAVMDPGLALERAKKGESSDDRYSKSFPASSI